MLLQITPKTIQDILFLFCKSMPNAEPIWLSTDFFNRVANVLFCRVTFYKIG